MPKIEGEGVPIGFPPKTDCAGVEKVVFSSPAVSFLASGFVNSDFPPVALIEL